MGTVNRATSGLGRPARRHVLGYFRVILALQMGGMMRYPCVILKVSQGRTSWAGLISFHYNLIKGILKGPVINPANPWFKPSLNRAAWRILLHKQKPGSNALSIIQTGLMLSSRDSVLSEQSLGLEAGCWDGLVLQGLVVMPGTWNDGASPSNGD
jgi:hypothetical protein